VDEEGGFGCHGKGYKAMEPGPETDVFARWTSH
jgi:hypothetical protein